MKLIKFCKNNISKNDFGIIGSSLLVAEIMIIIGIGESAGLYIPTTWTAFFKYFGISQVCIAITGILTTILVIYDNYDIKRRKGNE